METAMAARGPIVCFVDDRVIGRKIINSSENDKVVPMKKARKSFPARTPTGTQDAKENTPKELEKETETPRRRRSRRTETIQKEESTEKLEKEKKTPGRKSRKHQTKDDTIEEQKEQEKTKQDAGSTETQELNSHNSSPVSMRSMRPVVHIQKILTTQNENNDDSESNADSARESDGSDAESTDDEIQFKSQTENDSAAQNASEAETKISRLKEMSEAYFAVHHNKKILTSDRTLSRLQNPRMTQQELQEHLFNSAGNHKEECSRLFKEYVTLFPKWIFQLRHGFNMLLHGLGSKRRLIEEFRKKMLADSVHIVVNGFFPSLTIKSILNMITEELLNYSGSFKNIIDQCNFIKSEYNSEDANELFLLIHNIDGPMLRNSKAQNALSYLASSSKIYVIASIDHINAPVVWDQNRSSRFNWLWYDTATFDRYTEETSFENSLLVQQTGSLALSSLTHVLRSLTPNAKGIFKLLVEYQLENDSDTNYIGISFGDLYQKCREKFLVNSDLTLRAQLTEFRDHKLIKTKKGNDGVENLSIPLNSAALKQFMEDSDL